MSSQADMCTSIMPELRTIVDEDRVSDGQRRTVSENRGDAIPFTITDVPVTLESAIFNICLTLDERNRPSIKMFDIHTKSIMLKTALVHPKHTTGCEQTTPT